MSKQQQHFKWQHEQNANITINLNMDVNNNIDVNNSNICKDNINIVIKHQVEQQQH